MNSTRKIAEYEINSSKLKFSISMKTARKLGNKAI